jgi:ribosomal protein S18 acetylase RimI-like enzyme
MQELAGEAITVRALTTGDLGAVVAIDATIEGRSRRSYIERRLRAALREPRLHAQFAAVDSLGLVGHLLGRVLEGEFGRDERALRIELVGVRGDSRGHGIGSQLFAALAAWSARHRIGALRTQASWRDSTMLGWLDAMGFALDRGRILECDVADGARRADADDPGADSEIAFARSFADTVRSDLEAVASSGIEVRTMAADDLDAIVRIDGRLTYRDRRSYLAGRLDEALDPGGVRVSLVASVDGAPAGFVMARADRGDFGRIEPIAVLDTIGVDPRRVRRGIGRALLRQLFLNLSALRIERVETVVAPNDDALSGFLRAAGFAPSQRLAFVRAIHAA